MPQIVEISKGNLKVAFNILEKILSHPYADDQEELNKIAEEYQNLRLVKLTKNKTPT